MRASGAEETTQHTPGTLAKIIWAAPLDGQSWNFILKNMLNYQLDKTFAALADPARRTIVERLAQGPATVSELARPLPMSLPAAMLHLKVLEESGLVTSEKLGRGKACRLDPPMLSQAEQFVAHRRPMWERAL